jgi:hypothetical protein
MSSTIESYSKRGANQGGAIIMVLVFAGVFVMAVGSLLQFVLQQSVSGRGKIAYEESMQIAEAGLEYYKWLLANNPSSQWQGTMEYKDPQSGLRIGEFNISTIVNQQCGEIMSRDITVVGIPDRDTNYNRTVSARYMLPSVANYSYLIDESVWAGSTRTIIGPYYSSGGIRMDATHNSLVTSGVSSWSCDPSFGCNPTETKDGVWGIGSDPTLWQYPKTLTDFNNINPNFADLKNKAVSSGRFFGSVSGGVGDSGYHIIFKSDGTFDMYRVDSASYNWGWGNGGVAHRDYHTIDSETFLGNYTIPSTCSLIYVEDQLWLEGVVSGKVALVVADTVNSGYNPDVVLHNNLTYNTAAGNDGITVISEGDIEISAKSPEDLTVSGIFVAPNGRFGRYHYVENAGNYWDFGTSSWIYAPGVGESQDLGTFTLNGTVVSSQRTGTAWGYGLYMQYLWWYVYIEEDSGFTTRVNSYERVLAADPPPFTPASDTVPYLINWREK